MAEREAADTRRRLLLLAAASIGSGASADGLLLQAAGRASAGTGGIQERFLTCFTLALGGPRAGGGGVPELAGLAGRRGLVPLEQTAIAAAIARFPDAAPPPERWYQDDDLAVVAAAVFARPPADQRSIDSLLAREPRHADLVRRASLLGARIGGFEPERATRFRAWLAEGGQDAQPLRLAVALHLAASEDPERWVDRGAVPLHEDLLHVFAAEPAFRRSLWARGDLDPPSTLRPAVARERIAVGFALATDVDGLRRTADAWAKDEVAARALCLGLAWRLYRESPADHSGWLDPLPDVREAEWVRLACGVAPKAPSRSMSDERLDRAFLVAIDPSDRLDREAAAREIEDALWRSGAHPAATRVEAELDLLRDLALAGSTHGAAVLGLGTDPRRRHLPRGLSEGDPVFEIGYEVYRAFREPAPRRPEQARLR